MSYSGSTEKLSSSTSEPSSFSSRLFITLVILGQESGQRVKMNEVMADSIRQVGR